MNGTLHVSFSRQGFGQGDRYVLVIHPTGGGAALVNGALVEHLDSRRGVTQVSACLNREGNIIYLKYWEVSLVPLRIRLDRLATELAQRAGELLGYDHVELELLVRGRKECYPTRRRLYRRVRDQIWRDVTANRQPVAA